MVRLRVHALLKERGWTAYRLAQETSFSLSRAYRLAQKNGRFDSLRSETLNELCEVFGVGPGKIVEYLPGKRKR